jgi:hypothetical protein
MTLGGMSQRTENGRLRRIDTLLAWAAVTRKDWLQAKHRSDERRRILTGMRWVWGQKRDEWLSAKERQLSRRTEDLPLPPTRHS